MKEIQQFIQTGQLKEAITTCETSLKDDPVNFDLRSRFIELLCLNNELERADKQLDYMVQKKPEYAVGAINLRQLIRAQQNRLDFHAGKATPELFHETDEHDQAFLDLHLATIEQDKAVIQTSAEALEAQRKPVSLLINGKPVTEIRDIDDTLCGYLELFGTNGKYYLARFDEIESLTLQPAQNFLEHFWLRVEVNIKDGPSGQAHLPVTYVHHDSEMQNLAKETDWHELAEDVYQGRGMKTFLINDDAVPLHQIEVISAEETSD